MYRPGSFSTRAIPWVVFTDPASRAGEMIDEVALAMRAGVFTGRLAQTVHAYSTWSLAIQHAAAQFFDGYGGRTAPARPA